MPPSLHAILGASSAKRWLNCPPSARLHERLTDRFGSSESPFAREGTLAHALAELKERAAIYRADGMTKAKSAAMSPEERDIYPGINEFRYNTLRNELGDISAELEQVADTYCDVVMEKYLRAKEYDPSTRIFLEQRLDYSKWVPSGFGTGDSLIVSNTSLEVIDLKAGKGIPVNAVDNPQIRLYALGALDRFGAFYDFPVVRGTIVQPRLDSISEETLTRDDLLGWAETEVVERARLAWIGAGEFKSGEHCRFCAAKAVCSARVAEALKMFESGLQAPGLIPDEQIPDILKTLDVAEAWIKDIRAYAENQALHGQTWSGWKLVHGKKPNRAWVDQEEVRAQLLRAGYGVEQFEEKRLRPVGEIEKTVGKKAFSALLGALVSQGEGKLTLVPEDDKRIAYQAVDAGLDDLLGGEKPTE